MLSLNGELTVKVDKFLVSENCSYLKALLLSDFMEKDKEEVDIHIDIPYEVFEAALMFAEKKHIDRFAHFSFHLKLLDLADMWCFDSLRDALEDILLENITISSVIELHTAANIYKMEELKKHCLKFESLVEREEDPIYRYMPIDPEDLPEDKNGKPKTISQRKGRRPSNCLFTD